MVNSARGLALMKYSYSKFSYIVLRWEKATGNDQIYLTQKKSPLGNR